MSRAKTLRALIPALAALAVLAIAAPAQADYEQVGNFAKGGGGEPSAQMTYATSMAVNTTGAGGVEPGSVYVGAGFFNHRVLRYSPTGELKEVWGWNTVQSGPDQANELESLNVKAASGTYTLTATTVEAIGETTEGSKVVTVVRNNYGAFHVGDAVSGLHIPPGTTITSVGAGTLELSVAAESTGFFSLNVTETTAPIQSTASAAEVKAALVALEDFEAADLSITGGPGDAEGTSPYEVSFEGAYSGKNVKQMSSATAVSLSGGVPSSSVIVETLNQGEVGYERCRPDNGDVCTSFSNAADDGGSERVGDVTPLGIAVDQSTGYVYVLNQAAFPGREHNLIEVFSADGSESIARFGDAASATETIVESPEKVHGGGREGSIVADDTGKVYLSDGLRVMCFRPETPGDYEHYVYCGRSQDIELNSPARELALDNADHLYVNVPAQERLIELSLGEPSSPPLCTYNTNGQLSAMTVNSLTGEVFYFMSTKSRLGLYRFKPCNPEQGKFEEAQAPVKGSPPIGQINGLAFNPTLSWGPNRPLGILYGADRARHQKETPAYEGLGYIFAPAEVHAPEVLSESVSNTRTASAILHAKINPHGFGARYVFQYLSEAQYEANEPSERFAGATEAPLGGGEISGGSVGEVVASISGLAPDTAYRFRVVATSQCDPESGEPCVSEAEAVPFATYPLFPPGLPDHRVYEMVSPAQKHGGEVIPANPFIGSCGNCKPSPFGNVFPMQSSSDGEAVAYEGQPFTPFEGAVNYDSYVSRRTESGWQTTALIPALPPEEVRPLAFDPSLGHPLIGFREANQGIFGKLEIQSSESGATAPLLGEEPPNRSANEFKISYGGHSADLSRIFFGANDALTEEAPFAPEPPDPGVSKNDLYEWREGQLAVVNVLPGNATVATGAKFASISPDTHAVSEGGSKVFFKDEAGHLYVREGGETTKQINDPGAFLSASSNGSKVLLTDGCLYSIESESCTDLTEGRGGFQGLVGQSKDLSHIYFVDSAVLAENEGAGLDSEGNPQVAEAGKNNLYSWSGEETRFIAQLATDEDNVLGMGNSLLADWDSNPSHRSAEASPNGRFLAFSSVASLTDYDNVGPCEKSLNPENESVTIQVPCQEAFLYDSATGKLTCASCNPTGEAPLGNTTLRRIEGAPKEFPQPRYLTDEGRLYFDTQDSLSARDTNEGVEDVYEFSPQGTGAQGTCQRESGCASLISAGTEAVDSNLIAVDETGKNVFFDTRDKLALKDKDELLDIYDAREGGGIAAESEIARAECQGENCQAPASPPNDPTPASSSFEGAGNVKEAPVAKKHKHAKKKHKKHAKKHKQARTAKRNHGGAK